MKSVKIEQYPNRPSLAECVTAMRRERAGVGAMSVSQAYEIAEAMLASRNAEAKAEESR